MNLLKNKNYKLKASRGFIAISTVILVAVITLAIAVMVTYISLNDAQSSLASFKGAENLNFIEGCTNDAILKIRNSASYAGGNISYPEGSCSVTVSKAGTTYTVTASPVSTTYQKKIQAVVVRGSTTVTISSWQEI
jgi:hypothetical protein